MRTKISLGAAAIIVCAFPINAPAQEPGQDPCPATVVAVDPAGDQRLFGTGPNGTAPANTDIIEGSLRSAKLGTAPRRVTVTLTISDLTKTVPPYATEIHWYYEYTLNGAAQFVATRLRSDGTVAYSTGTVGSSYTPTGTTTGTFTTGTPGTITMVLPGMSSPTASYDLTATRFRNWLAVGGEFPVLGEAAGLAGADSVNADDYKAVPCVVS